MHKSICFSVLGLFFSLPSARGQQPAPKQTAPVAASGLAFEVATIKPAAPSPDGHNHIYYPAGDRFGAQNVTLLMLLDWAYRLPQTQILDAPAWLRSTYFDIDAKLEAADAPANLSDGEDQARKRRMVQALLGERCKLKLHGETRVLPAYDLVIAKGGSKLQPSTNGGLSISTGRSRLNEQGLTPAMLAEQLSYVAGRVVVDRTNLSGRFDVKLQWTPDGTPIGENSPPALFTAIQEQLGLRLDSAKEPVDVLVIDHVELPSAN